MGSIEFLCSDVLWLKLLFEDAVTAVFAKCANRNLILKFHNAFLC